MSAPKHKIELKAEKRTILGSKVKKLRKEGYLPGVLYGKKQEPISLQVPVKDFHKTFKESGESTLVYLTLDLPAQAGGRQTYPTIIHDVTRDPIHETYEHADFYKVNLDEKIKAMVPVAFEGESLAVKESGGIFIRNINELEVEALPQDLPHEIKIDISPLKSFGDNITIGDLKADKGTVFIGHKGDIIATVQEPMSEEELKASLEGEIKGVEDIEVIGEKEKEGKEPQEDEAGKKEETAQAQEKEKSKEAA